MLTYWPRWKRIDPGKNCFDPGGTEKNTKRKKKRENISAIAPRALRPPFDLQLPQRSFCIRNENRTAIISNYSPLFPAGKIGLMSNYSYPTITMIILKMTIVMFSSHLVYKTCTLLNTTFLLMNKISGMSYSYMTFKPAIVLSGGGMLFPIELYILF